MNLTKILLLSLSMVIVGGLNAAETTVPKKGKMSGKTIIRETYTCNPNDKSENYVNLEFNSGTERVLAWLRFTRGVNQDDMKKALEECIADQAMYYKWGTEKDKQNACEALASIAQLIDTKMPKLQEQTRPYSCEAHVISYGKDDQPNREVKNKCYRFYTHDNVRYHDTRYESCESCQNYEMCKKRAQQINELTKTLDQGIDKIGKPIFEMANNVSWPD